MRFALRSTPTTPSRRVARSAGAVTALALGASLMAAPQSYAADSPSIRELLNACDSADVCEFHPQSYTAYTGPAHQVGSTAYNCASETNQHTVTWFDTTSATNSVGVAIEAGVEFWKVYKASVEVSYSHSWTTSHTDSETKTLNVRPGYKGWLQRGTAKQKAKGWYELHFGKRYYGHYIWYINNYEAAGWDQDHPQNGYVNFKDTVMTSGERAAHCG
ncbi:hypothetical protein [Streptomyces sp. YU58]|uniref:hypothetical protein n=1 Tax=Streptomyces sp. SX92 TaxID=3158972 RepID=UPI0027BAFADF|nr:hypothetical protein [Streptomyces coralus]WLW50297.1 hypothetical protein QU709_02505 [Streptomyces coralus]